MQFLTKHQNQERLHDMNKCSIFAAADKKKKWNIFFFKCLIAIGTNTEDMYWDFYDRSGTLRCLIMWISRVINNYHNFTAPQHKKLLTLTAIYRRFTWFDHYRGTAYVTEKTLSNTTSGIVIWNDILKQKTFFLRQALHPGISNGKHPLSIPQNHFLPRNYPVAITAKPKLTHEEKDDILNVP